MSGMRWRVNALAIALMGLTQLIFVSAASAQGALVSGRVLLVEGHESPLCRRLQLRLDNGSDLWFRLPDTGADNSILAVGLTAIGTGRKVGIAYQAGVGTGCGNEPKINYISLLAE